MQIYFESEFHKDLYGRVYKSNPGVSIKTWNEFISKYPKYRKYRKTWLASRLPENTPLTQAIPWICYPAIEWLSKVVGHRDRVFEWGMGGSTIFLAKRCQQVISVEHDHRWFLAAKDEIANRVTGNRFERIKRVLSKQKMPELFFIEADIGNNDVSGFRSGAKGYELHDFEKYVRYIEHYPCGHFKLVLIDGRARLDCLLHALPYVKVGGYVVLDNADYKRYRTRLQKLELHQLKGWDRVDYLGPGPSSSCIGWKTTVWQRKK